MTLSTADAKPDLKIDATTMRRLRWAFLLFTLMIGFLGATLVAIMGKPLYKGAVAGGLLLLLPWSIYFVFSRRNEAAALLIGAITCPLPMLALVRTKSYWQSILCCVLVILCGMLSVDLCLRVVGLMSKKQSMHPLADPELDSDRTRTSRSA